MSKVLKTSMPVVENSAEFYNNFIVKESYEEYDSYGNPTYVIKDDNTKIVYIWGYNRQHLIAEIKNATGFDVCMAVGGVNGTGILDAITYDAVMTDNNWGYITKLRTHSRLANAHVTIYKHKPLVGITEIIDPTGVSTHYSYDNSGRLENTFIEEKLPTKSYKWAIDHYQYNYKNH